VAGSPSMSSRSGRESGNGSSTGAYRPAAAVDWLVGILRVAGQDWAVAQEDADGPLVAAVRGVISETGAVRDLPRPVRVTGHGASPHLGSQRTPDRVAQ
jgi:hypothetical protein